jgi:hypothetical protein
MEVKFNVVQLFDFENNRHFLFFKIFKSNNN